MDNTSFVNYLVELGRSSKTISAYASDLGLFATWFKQSNGYELTPATITRQDVLEFRQHMAQAHHAPATINRRLAALRAYSEWAHRLGGASLNLANIKRAGSQAQAPHWLDRREVAAIHRQLERAITSSTPGRKLAAQRAWSMVTLVLNTGLRVSELLALELSDLEITDRKGMLTVRAGKGDKLRRIPLNNQARQAITTWMELRAMDHPRLYCGLSARSFQVELAQLARRLGFAITPHILRHTFAKSLIDSGVSPEKVATLLGHESIDTTRLYITPGQRDLELAVSSLD